MPKYLFVFGFETPQQRANNAKHGWDDEDSASVFILAESKEQALQWGREVAEGFVASLHKDERVSWKQENFAAWIEEDFEERYQPDQLDRIPVVPVGEYPKWSAES